MTKNYKIIFQYDGTSYNGFQKQGNTTNTIQAKFENILSRLAGTPIEIAASGRTDAGVHAKAQVANFHIDTALTEKEIINYINTYLPEDITVLSIETAADRFHSRLCATGKIYSYHIDLSEKADVFMRRYCLSHTSPLNIDAMKEAATYLVGTHDYKAFSSLKKTKKSTIRTVNSIEFSQAGNELVITYNGNGFLYNMVRIITGTLIKVGEGDLSPSDIPAIIKSCDRSNSGPLAPAKGLFLEKVLY